MARKPMEMIRADAELKFPDNTTGEISPADLRSWALDLVDTMTPGYGAMNIATPPITQSIGQASAVVTAYDSIVLVTEPFSVDTTAGTVTANVDIVGDLSVQASVEMPQARELTLTAYRNGMAMAYSAEVDGEGANNPVTVALDGILDLSAGDVMDIRARVDGTSSVNVTFTRNLFIVRAVPRREAP